MDFIIYIQGFDNVVLKTFVIKRSQMQLIIWKYTISYKSHCNGYYLKHKHLQRNVKPRKVNGVLNQQSKIYSFFKQTGIAEK